MSSGKVSRRASSNIIEHQTKENNVPRSINSVGSSRRHSFDSRASYDSQKKRIVLTKIFSSASLDIDSLLHLAEDDKLEEGKEMIVPQSPKPDFDDILDMAESILIRSKSFPVLKYSSYEVNKKEVSFVAENVANNFNKKIEKENMIFSDGNNEAVVRDEKKTHVSVSAMKNALRESHSMSSLLDMGNEDLEIPLPITGDIDGMLGAETGNCAPQMQIIDPIYHDTDIDKILKEVEVENYSYRQRYSFSTTAGDFFQTIVNTLFFLPPPDPLATDDISSNSSTKLIQPIDVDTLIRPCPTESQKTIQAESDIDRVLEVSYQMKSLLVTE